MSELLLAPENTALLGRISPGWETIAYQTSRYMENYPVSTGHRDRGAPQKRYKDILKGPSPFATRHGVKYTEMYLNTNKLEGFKSKYF